MLAHLMPFVTEKPGGSRKVWRAKGARGGSGPVPQRGWGSASAAEGQPHRRAQASGSLRSRGPPQPEWRRSAARATAPVTELPANPAKRIISLLRQIAAVRRSRNGASGRGVRLAGLGVPAALTGSSGSGAEQRRPRGRAAGRGPGRRASTRQGPAPLPLPTSRALTCSPHSFRRGDQPSSGQSSPSQAGCSAAPATQIHSSHAEGVGKCGKLPWEVESSAAVAWHSEGHNSASGADVLTACPPQGKNTNL